MLWLIEPLGNNRIKGGNRLTLPSTFSNLAQILKNFLCIYIKYIVKKTKKQENLLNRFIKATDGLWCFQKKYVATNATSSYTRVISSLIRLAVGWCCTNEKFSITQSWTNMEILWHIYCLIRMFYNWSSLKMFKPTFIAKCTAMMCRHYIMSTRNA